MFSTNISDRITVHSATINTIFNNVLVTEYDIIENIIALLHIQIQDRQKWVVMQIFITIANSLTH